MGVTYPQRKSGRLGHHLQAALFADSSCNTFILLVIGYGDLLDFQAADRIWRMISQSDHVKCTLGFVLPDFSFR